MSNVRYRWSYLFCVWLRWLNFNFPMLLFLPVVLVRPKKMQVYCMIGHEPIADCLQRIEEIIAWGGEPYVQRNMKLNAPEKVPWVRHDWTLQSLINVSRWANRHVWRYVPFSEYRPGVKTSRRVSKAQMVLA